MNYTWREADRDTILRVTVGSSVHGVAVEGTDDRDEMAVFIPPPAVALGLDRCDTIIHRTQPEGARSGPGDLDLTMHSLSKFCRLALNGNPSILLALYSPDPLVLTGAGGRLRDMTDAFASKRVLQAFLGYMHEQRRRLKGEIGQKAIKRPELVERYGFDTKYAGHVIRLGLQGLEYARTGALSLPMPALDRHTVLHVRTGIHDLDAVLNMALRLEGELRDELDASRLPADADRGRVEQFIVDEHLRAWSA